MRYLQLAIGVALVAVLVFGCNPSENDVQTPAQVSIQGPMFCENGGYGCTPGYWKNHRMHECEWVAAGYTPGQDFDTVFGTDYFNPNLTLMQALRAGGGDGNGWNRLGRHGTAALLNAANPDVDYPLSTSEVIDAVRAGQTSMLAGYNEDSPCPLSNCKH
ncbi:MAG: hypothetical protein JSW58_10015 [Candidatus Latescibacterota bacterium]|nr:MAG: hypothetical protein JSW58_10015 [Candidatus Latescibacterota bacterium]